MYSVKQAARAYRRALKREHKHFTCNDYVVDDRYLDLIEATNKAALNLSLASTRAHSKDNLSDEVVAKLLAWEEHFK